MKQKRGESQVRRGKWSSEEEIFTMKMISLFNQGLLQIHSGTTLRSYLSKQLQCNPMRVTKKFAGQSCIGKQIFQPCDDTSLNMELIKRGTEELTKLESTFRSRAKSKKPSKRRKTVLRDDVSDSRSRESITSSKQDSIASGTSSNSTDEDDYDEDDDDDGEEEDDDNESNNGISVSESKYPDEYPYYKTVPRRVHKTYRSTASSSSENNSLYVSLNDDLSFQTISAMGITVEYEKYDKDVDAAGDLLLQFSQKVRSDELL